MPKATPIDAIMEQISTMMALQSKLRSIVNELHETIDPNAATWQDVGKYAMYADAARDLMATFAESEEG